VVRGIFIICPVLLMNGVDPYRVVRYDAVGSNASPFMGNEAIERDSYVFKLGKITKRDGFFVLQGF